MDKSIAKLEEDVGKIDKATDGKLVVLTSSVDGKLKDFGTEQDKALKALTDKLEKSVKVATDAAADAKAKAEGFKVAIPPPLPMANSTRNAVVDRRLDSPPTPCLGDGGLRVAYCASVRYCELWLLYATVNYG